MILIDPLDAGPELDGSIFLRCFSTLWYYRNRPTLYCKTEDWAVLFDILLCFMPVYKNANDDHRGGHLDYSWASQSCLFLSGLLSLHLFSNPCSLRLEFHRQWWRAVVSECPSIRMGMCRWRQSWTIFVCVCVSKNFCPLWPLGCTLQSVILSSPPVWALAPPASPKSSSHLSVLGLPTAPYCSQGEFPSAAFMLPPSFMCTLLVSVQSLLLKQPHKRVWIL